MSTTCRYNNGGCTEPRAHPLTKCHYHHGGHQYSQRKGRGQNNKDDDLEQFLRKTMSKCAYNQLCTTRLQQGTHTHAQTQKSFERQRISRNIQEQKMGVTEREIKINVDGSQFIQETKNWASQTLTTEQILKEKWKTSEQAFVHRSVDERLRRLDPAWARNFMQTESRFRGTHYHTLPDVGLYRHTDQPWSVARAQFRAEWQKVLATVDAKCPTAAIAQSLTLETPAGTKAAARALDARSALIAQLYPHLGGVHVEMATLARRARHHARVTQGQSERVYMGQFSPVGRQMCQQPTAYPESYLSGPYRQQYGMALRQLTAQLAMAGIPPGCTEYYARIKQLLPLDHPDELIQAQRVHALPQDYTLSTVNYQRHPLLLGLSGHQVMTFGADNPAHHALRLRMDFVEDFAAGNFAVLEEMAQTLHTMIRLIKSHDGVPVEMREWRFHTVTDWTDAQRAPSAWTNHLSQSPAEWTHTHVGCDMDHPGWAQVLFSGDEPGGLCPMYLPTPYIQAIIADQPESCETFRALARDAWPALIHDRQIASHGLDNAVVVGHRDGGEPWTVPRHLLDQREFQWAKESAAALQASHG